MNSSPEQPLPIKELTQKVIGCAYAVHNQLGYGFLESVYEKSLLIELGKQGITASAQEPIKVFSTLKWLATFSPTCLLKAD